MTDFEVPTVTCDVELGRITDDLEFDSGHIAEVMRGHGIAETDIAAHNIHFSSEAVLDEHGAYLMGKYDYSDNTTTIYIGSRHHSSSYLWERVANSLRQREENENGKMPEGTLDRIVSNVMSMGCNDTLLHETHHAIEAALVSQEEWEEGRKQRWEAKEWVQEKKKAILMTIAMLAMATPVVETYEGVTPGVFEKTGIVAMAVTGVCAILASLPESQKRRHRHYRDSPWEAAARDFAEEFVPDDAENSDLPLRIKFKRADRLPA